MTYQEYDFRVIKQPNDRIEDLKILASEYDQARKKLSEKYRGHSIMDKIKDQMQKG